MNRANHTDFLKFYWDNLIINLHYIYYNLKGSPDSDDIPVIPVQGPAKEEPEEVPGFFKVDSTDKVTEPNVEILLDDYLALEHQIPYNQRGKIQKSGHQSSHKEIPSDLMLT